MATAEVVLRDKPGTMDNRFPQLRRVTQSPSAIRASIGLSILLLAVYSVSCAVTKTGRIVDTSQTGPQAQRPTFPDTTGPNLACSDGQVLPDAAGRSFAGSDGQVLPDAAGRSFAGSEGRGMPETAGRTRPGTAGQDLQESIDHLLQTEVDSHHIAGAAILVVQDGETLHRGAYGFAQREEFGGTPLHPPDSLSADHVFDLASLTKVFATTFGLMLLVDRGAVAPDAPVSSYLPEFAGGSKDSVTVRHLLTHTSGLTPWEPLYYHASTPSETYEYIATQPLRYPVGRERHYSDLGFMLLGYLIENVSGQPLDAFLRENLYEPLDLQSTTFRPLQNGIDRARIAATSHGNPFERKMVYDDDFGYHVNIDPESWAGWRHYTLRGEVNDGNSFYAHQGVAGHAGLFSTIDDLQRLVEVLLNHGEGLIDADVVRVFLTKDEHGNGLGWAMDLSFIQARGAPEGTFGHTGFTGTNVVVVPAYDLSIILLTNRQNVGTQPDGSYYNLNPTRQRVTTLVLDAVSR